MNRFFLLLSSVFFSLALAHISVSTPSLSEDALASQIQNAAFNDISPGFDDLYMIRTQDKGRVIVIYCNAAYCYKNRNSLMTA